MSQIREALDLLLPLLAGGGAFLLLLLIRRPLRRRMRANSLGAVYLAGSALLGVLLFLNGEDLLPVGLGRSLLIACLIVAWGYTVFDLLEELLFERALRRRGPGVARLGRDIVRGLVLVALVLIAINRLFGVPLSSLLISSTVASAVLGLALQDLLKDVIAGVALQTERPFAPGDWLLLRGQPAKVVETNWRATRLVTPDSTHLVVPNASLGLAEISNYSLYTPLQALHVQIMLSPEHPPNEVKQVLNAAALAAEGVLSDPPPQTRLIAYGEYSVTYDVKFWLDGYEQHIDTRDAVMTSMWYHVRRAGLRLPYPVRDIFLHPSDTHTTADEREQRRAEILAALRSVELFSALSEAELAELAERTELRVYADGEVLVRQGGLDSQLFVICRGAVHVEATPEGGGPAIRLNGLRAGDVFGELALLTGAARRATVRADGDMQALVVSREALAPLLARNPALPERLSAILEERVTESQNLLAEARNASPSNGATLSQPTLLGRIRSLFGLGDED